MFFFLCHFLAEGGTLLPRIPYEEGFHRLVVRIDQIGLKDAHIYLNSFFTVSVKGIVQQFDLFRSLFSSGGYIGRYQFILRVPNVFFFFFASIYADSNSVNVTPPQDTPISHRKDGKFINFGIDVEIQKPIEKLPRGTDIEGIDLACICQDCYLFRTQLSLHP